MSHAILYDFDYCLLESNCDEAVQALEPVFQVYIRSHPTLKKLPEADVMNVFWNNSPDVVVSHYNLTDTFFAWYGELPAAAKLYPDVWDVLELLRKENVRLFLATKGEEVFQRRKITHVGIEHFFGEMVIVEPRCEVKDKRTAFQDLMRRHRLMTHTTWVVGDGQE